MGVTNFSLTLIEKALNITEVKTVIELGAQNLYTAEHPGAPYASEWYEGKGIMYTCIDLNGENGALRINLGQPIPPTPIGVSSVSLVADIVTDFGTSEHVGPGKHDPESFYNCWKNKHHLCRAGGIIISENPMTGNWPGHGFNYVDKFFYLDLAKANGYEIIDLDSHAAMGNTTDGWNVYCILRKVKEEPFMKLSEFKKLSFYTK